MPAAQLAISIPKDFAAICAIYHGSDDRLYLRFKVTDLYHLAFSVDSMYVGNGLVLKRNDIEVLRNTSASL